MLGNLLSRGPTGIGIPKSGGRASQVLHPRPGELGGTATPQRPAARVPEPGHPPVVRSNGEISSLLFATRAEAYRPSLRRASPHAARGRAPTTLGPACCLGGTPFHACSERQRTKGRRIVATEADRSGGNGAGKDADAVEAPLLFAQPAAKTAHLVVGHVGRYLPGRGGGSQVHLGWLSTAGFVMGGVSPRSTHVHLSSAFPKFLLLCVQR